MLKFSFRYRCALLIGLMLLTLSLLNQYSALEGYSHAYKNHLIKTVLGLTLFFSCFLIDQFLLERIIPVGYFFCILALIGVELKGATIKGATRWLALGPFSFQPSEVAKVFTPLMSAHFLYQLRSHSSFIIFFAITTITFIPFLLVLKQPDLGSALLILFSGCAPLLISKISLRFFTYILISLIALSPILWLGLRPYQQERILTLLNPDKDLLGQGYHVAQSKIAIGSGQFFGKGFRKNTQANYDFLPEHDTDFAFAVFAEEWGFLGSSIVIILFFAFCVLLLRSSLLPNNYYAGLICFSLSAPLFIYAFINIGMISGLLPVVGVPMPFFSRGGTSFLSLMFSLGITSSLQRLHNRQKGASSF